VWFLFAREYSLRGWLWILFASTVATDLGFLLLEPDLGLVRGILWRAAWLHDGRAGRMAAVPSATR